MEELSQTVQRMTLEHMPVNRSEGSSTGQVRVNPMGSDITSALQIELQRWLSLSVEVHYR